MKHFAIGFLLLVSVQMANAGDFTKQKFEHFSMSLPNGVVVKKASPVEDFEIYTLEKNGQAYLNIYVGNQPSFPKRSAAAQEVTTKFSSGDVQIVSFWRSNKLSKMELLLRLEKQGWPTYLHAWISDGLSPEELGMAEAMLMSIDTRRANDKGAK